MTGAIVLRIAYGYKVVEGTDPFLEMFDARANIFTQSTQPAAFLVNVLPACMYLFSFTSLLIGTVSALLAGVVAGRRLPYDSQKVGEGDPKNGERFTRVC